MTHPFMVAIGHWAQPSVVQLQARTIRATCGDIPVLVSDDHTELTAFDDAKGIPRARAEGLKQKLLAVCAEEGLIYRDTAAEPIGHAGGDLGAFYHGLTYARDNGIPFLWKLSQRFVVDVPGWLARECRRMEKYAADTCTQPCFYGPRPVFAFRTESIGLRVFGTWARPGLLEHMRPRRLHRAAEHVVEENHAALGGRPFLQPVFFGPDRRAADPGVCWKDNEPKAATAAAYQALAAKYGVDLGEDFNVNHSLGQVGFHSWG